MSRPPWKQCPVDARLSGLTSESCSAAWLIGDLRASQEGGSGETVKPLAGRSAREAARADRPSCSLQTERADPSSAREVRSSLRFGRRAKSKAGPDARRLGVPAPADHNKGSARPRR